MRKKLSSIGVGSTVVIILIIGMLWSTCNLMIFNAHLKRHDWCFATDSSCWLPFKQGDTVYGNILLSSGKYYGSKLIIDSPCSGVVSVGRIWPSDKSTFNHILAGDLVDPRFDSSSPNGYSAADARFYIFKSYVELAFNSSYYNCLPYQDQKHIDVMESLSNYYAEHALLAIEGRYCQGFSTFLDPRDSWRLFVLTDKPNPTSGKSYRYPFAKGDTVVGDIVFDDGSDKGLLFKKAIVKNSQYPGTVMNGIIYPDSEFNIKQYLGYEPRFVNPTIDKPDIY